MVTLGRPLHLGTLYNMRSDKIITAVTLWDPEILANNTILRKQPFTGFEIIAEDSLQNKAHALGIDASLKLSLLGGLIRVSGSAKYAEDYQRTNHETRLTLKYSTTTHMETLSMKHLGKGNLNHPDLHDIDLATHVVTGVLYGAEAFFIFDRTVSNGESKKEISGSLRAVFDNPIFKIDGEAKFDLTEQEKKFVDKLRCKFYGDFRLNANPNTFAEAVKIYRQLPSLLGENNENAVPKKVWLYPLHLLDNKAMRIVRDISSNLIDYSMSVIEKLRSLEVRASDLSQSAIFTHFDYMKNHLLDFVERLKEIQEDLKKEIALNLPKLRGNTGIEESVLFNLFKQVDSSPFNQRKLESWLEEKRKEIALITSWARNLATDKSLNIMNESLSLNEVIGDTRYDYIVCLSFRFVEENDPQLSDMYNYRYDKPNLNSSNSRRKSTKWFEDRRIIAKIRKNVQQFIEFAKANNVDNEKLKFIVDEEYLVDHIENAELILYDAGSEEKGFIIPSKPDAPYAKNVTDNNVTLRWTDVAKGTKQVNKYKVMYRKYSSEILVDKNDSMEESKWTEINTTANDTEIVISGLPSKTTFVFKVQAITAIGLSTVSELSEPISTQEKEKKDRKFALFACLL
ncbi:unnamed protein product [Rotaria sp. Silwood1]|nr:unnamed protein product [Rotaria sp. Silwood1]CAF1681187.1 unnamed protein product [Rotaria sp. Silwood1]CAF3858840.1 unnamed protein product [Rotaria sp. Silwood1]CAF3879979.1 unnamed protein product [Rotaria sp. Silwood1]CAF4920018.1 unnamed protein product [Rotaria sp. Silwood1]